MGMGKTEGRLLFRKRIIILVGSNARVEAPAVDSKEMGGDVGRRFDETKCQENKEHRGDAVPVHPASKSFEMHVFLQSSWVIFSDEARARKNPWIEASRDTTLKRGILSQAQVVSFRSL